MGTMSKHDKIKSWRMARSDRMTGWKMETWGQQYGWIWQNDRIEIHIQSNKVFKTSLKLKGMKWEQYQGCCDHFTNILAGLGGVACCWMKIWCQRFGERFPNLIPAPSLIETSFKMRWLEMVNYKSMIIFDQVKKLDLVYRLIVRFIMAPQRQM